MNGFTVKNKNVDAISISRTEVGRTQKKVQPTHEGYFRRKIMMTITLRTEAKRWIVVAGLVLLLITTLLIGCGSSSLKVGWRETSSLKRKQAQYVTFDGTQTKTFRAEAGQTIILDYEVTVEKGSLTLKLIAPSGESLWEETHHEDGEDTISVTVPDDGRYTLHIAGEQTGGSFDISWSIQE